MPIFRARGPPCANRRWYHAVKGPLSLIRQPAPGNRDRADASIPGFADPLFMIEARFSYAVVIPIPTAKMRERSAHGLLILVIWIYA
jgi:hypothetical protein